MADDECAGCMCCAGAGNVSREEDALRAQLAEAERERDEARARLRYTCQVLVEAAGADGPLSAEEAAKRAAGQLDSLRSRAAKLETVVEAARVRLTDGLTSAAGLDHTGPGSASFSRIFPEDTYPTNEKEADAFVKARMRLWFTTWIVTPMQDALRALDSPVVAGTDSGGSDGIATREDAGTAPSGSERSTPPEPAGSIPCVIGPPLRFDSRGAFDDDDSPVGVAATAETAREDGSTGAVDEAARCGEWLPTAGTTCALPSGHAGVHDPYCPGHRPPTLREIHTATRAELAGLRADVITRAELVAAVRSAASAVGGPPRRALDALADALEIPRT